MLFGDFIFFRFLLEPGREVVPCSLTETKSVLPDWQALYQMCQAKFKLNLAKILGYYKTANMKSLVHSLDLQMIEQHCLYAKA